MTRSASRDPDWVGLSEASRVLGVSPATLRRWSGAARVLWNLARDQRRWFPGQSIGRVSQCLELTELRREVEWLADLPAQTGQQVLADVLVDLCNVRISIVGKWY